MEPVAKKMPKCKPTLPKPKPKPRPKPSSSSSSSLAPRPIGTKPGEYGFYGPEPYLRPKVSSGGGSAKAPLPREPPPAHLLKKSKGKGKAKRKLKIDQVKILKANLSKVQEYVRHLKCKLRDLGVSSSSDVE
eukprot:4009743-Pyramimonas_sp.AAC.1